MKQPRISTIGFPRMHKERGEIRDFLPPLIHRIAPLAHKIVLEEGYGSGMGIEAKQYNHRYANVHFATNQECYKQDIVVQVRSPEDDELLLMRPNTLLLAMLHYPTHRKRVNLLQKLGLKAISMDSIIDDNRQRLVENLRGTSWNAIEVGFKAMQETYLAFASLNRKPIEVLIMGGGVIGRFAVEAAIKYGDIVLHQSLLENKVSGVIVHIIGRNITYDLKVLRELFEHTDMLVDATFRSDPTKCIIPNELIGILPKYAIIVDLTVDPYVTDIVPIQVKAIEGIPTGNLDQYEFLSNDPAFEQLPAEVSTKNRRMTVSCYSWPGLKPLECMRRYGQQLGRILEILLETSYDDLSLESNHYFERALYRGSLKYYLEKL